ncbi:MAG: RNA-binding transcriptional accessory protein, partial [Ruminococcaceae bacterium]|nr:RNA-binding transcriptional accessory protein [Oscillospiraceae bacterium]
MDILAVLCNEFHLEQKRVENTVALIDEGNTIPFIARYRKEVTGSLDDQVLRELSERLTYLRGLEKRREEVSASIEEQGKMTEELAAAIAAAATLAEIEDLYRPYRPKRKTRASVAREKGLEPLAEEIFAQKPDSAEPIVLAEGYVDPEKGVETAEDALAGAKDIIAENISDDALIRKLLREFIQKLGSLSSKAAKEEASVYEMYYDFSEPVAKLPGHRILAIDRGEREEFLKVSVEADRERALAIVYNHSVLDTHSPCNEAVRQAAEDAFDRLIFPSIEREIRSGLTENACEQA